MKTQILTVLSIMLFGAVATYGMSVTKNDSVTTDRTSVECVVYPGQDGLITFRMVKAPGEVVKVNLYDEEGNLMSTRRYKKPSNIKLLYDLSQWPAGLYQIRVKTGKNEVFTTTVPYSETALAGK